VIVHLVDGTFELFRQFYGRRRGGPDSSMGAVIGVLHSILEMFEKGATHLGVATDHVIESFRNTLWPGYKTGEGVDPELLAQFHLRAGGSTIEWGHDFGAEDESRIVAGRDRPVFIYNYPKSAKAFYMKENPDDRRTVLCNDCLAPEGYGEIIGGSQREDDYDRLLARIRHDGFPEEVYGWYLDLRRTAPSCTPASSARCSVRR